MYKDIFDSGKYILTKITYIPTGINSPISDAVTSWYIMPNVYLYINECRRLRRQHTLGGLKVLLVGIIQYLFYLDIQIHYCNGWCYNNWGKLYIYIQILITAEIEESVREK